ncbi:hypothetical protein Q6A83_05780 [Aliarcobacter skirrowii]|uniref:hypothetical protein n=1 Tax=Aliarcobacter skirrowii TaxID=28200 RepID=UPI0029A9259E|nr:hypothetical protein [Aliarcobacter skirrowii]MDX4050282.1 hypothetical protein [Aliarcobacter skirrowii]
MISPIQTGKTYGVLHTESFFSFLGFAKKVGSDETQKIDVYLDDKLIDTIEANEFIQKIDDMYDVESKAFTYNLPTQYIGKKAIISFKNHDSGEELLNSPYTLIDKNHEKFNEAKFLHSLSEPLSEELKNMYKPNSIGFLATKENLEDEEFVGYIKELMERFPDVEFKGFCFTKSENNKFKNFINGKIYIMVINHYKELLNTEILISTPDFINGNTNFTNIFVNDLQNIYLLNYHSINKNKLLKDFINPNHPFFTNKKYKFTDEEKNNAQGSANVLLYNILYNLSKEKQKVELEDSLYNLHNFERIRLILKSELVKQKLIELYSWKI